MYDDVEIIQEASEKMGVDYIGNATIIDLKGLSKSSYESRCYEHFQRDDSDSHLLLSRIK